MDKYYNPYDIFKRDDVKNRLDDVISRFKLKKTSATDWIAKGALVNATHAQVPLVKGLARIMEIGRNYDLKQLQREQIVHLADHPEDLGREIRILLASSAILLDETFELKEKADFFGPFVTLLRNCIRTMSFQEGMVESMTESANRDLCKMWIVLKAPLSLLMNAYYLNKNISSDVFDSYLSDLIAAGKKSQLIEDLCLLEFQNGFLDGSVKSYLENRFDEVIGHKDTIPHLEQMKDSLLSLRESLLEKLNQYAKDTDEFYGKEIEQWAKDYPATESGENYDMVVNALTTCLGIQKKDLTLGSRLTEDLGLNRQQRKALCEAFNGNKGFLIDSIYSDRFKTVGDIVSFWNAFDHLTPLDMTP